MTSPAPDYRPTASLAMLQLRARLLASARRFFDLRGYFEVDTPLLSHDRVVDPHLEPFRVEQGSTALYLQTSPEFGMKRLLTAGAQAIYQIGHVFRAGESGRLHNPEFTMIEWYRAGDTHLDQMQVVEDLVVELFKSAAGEPWTGAATRQPQAPFVRTTYREAFQKHSGCDINSLDGAGLAALARSKSVSSPASLDTSDRDGWLNLLLAELVEPHLGRKRPEFLIDYPASQAAIARIRNDDPPVAERFELYQGGIELCNGYRELTDATELRRRMAAESRRLAAAGQPPLAMTSRLLQAMEAGLPPCAGVALGFDRLLVLAAGAGSLDEVIPFPFSRA
ncbi:MAG: EF-P lysine aminoacylase GenX [Planctomycetia bacterium]|nr:EF-P lysine aminoacylase GenX [Planctomycetia bacterium]